MNEKLHIYQTYMIIYGPNGIWASFGKDDISFLRLVIDFRFLTAFVVVRAIIFLFVYVANWLFWSVLLTVKVYRGKRLRILFF